MNHCLSHYFSQVHYRANLPLGHSTSDTCVVYATVQKDSEQFDNGDRLLTIFHCQNRVRLLEGKIFKITPKLVKIMTQYIINEKRELNSL